jgi:hypothetical protein
VKTLDDSIWTLTGERDPLAQSMNWATPSDLFAAAARLSRQLADVAQSFKNGADVRRAAEPTVRGGSPTMWRGSLRSGAAEVATFASRFGVSGSEAEAIIATACRSFDELQHRAMFGTSGMSRESFIKNNLAAAGFKVAGGVR